MTPPDPRMIQLLMDLRRQGIDDPRLLAAIERTPRDLFVETAFQLDAFEDKALPIACGQTISQPFVVATMTQALMLADTHRVLEIGTGSGYQTAVLSRLCRRVYTVERYRSLLRDAERRFEALGLMNVTTRHGDGYRGWPETAPFDRILLTAAPPEIPAALLSQLKEGGILVAPVGTESNWQRLVRIMVNGGVPQSEELIAVRFVPMVLGVAPEA